MIEIGELFSLLAICMNSQRHSNYSACSYLISDSKSSIGFNQERKIEKCDQNLACPGNMIQTCGCLDKTSMYPMVLGWKKCLKS